MKEIQNTIEFLVRTGRIENDDVDEVYDSFMEEKLLKHNIVYPKISKRMKGNVEQYYTTVPRKYSRTGERHQLTAESEKELKKKFRKEALDVIEHNEYAELADSATVEDAVVLFLKDITPADGHKGKVKRTTAERYMRGYINYIKDTPFGQRKLKHVKLYHCEDFIQSLYDREITAEYVSQIKSIVKRAFDYACGHDFMTKNYMVFTKINPTLCSMKNKRETEVWEDEEIQEICSRSLEFWKKKQFRYSAVVPILVFSGIRIGELLAATWDDVNFISGTISITKTVIEYTDYESKQKCRGVDTTKTTDSRRNIELTEEAIWWLKEMRKRNMQMGIDSVNIVPTKKGRIPKECQVLVSLKRFCEKIGVKYKSSHTCRRTYATLLIDGGIPITQVSKDLGHKKITTTQNNYYKCRKQQEEVMDKKNMIINNIFSGTMSGWQTAADLATSGNTLCKELPCEKAL